jgi:hypothetical protein
VKGALAFVAFALAGLAAGGASADDLTQMGLETTDQQALAAAQAQAEPADQTYQLQFINEIRVGPYIHNWIHNEDAPFDVSVEALSSPLAFPGWNSPWAASPWVNWLLTPRMNVGAMLNTGGKTSYGYGGFTWRLPIWGKFFFEAELGGAINNAVREPTYHRVDMGCPLTFRESGGFGYQFNEHFDLIASIEHVSHLRFCNATINPGLTQVGFKVGYKF